MVDLRFLSEPLTAAASGLGSDDERLLELLALADKDRIAEASERVEALLRERIYDIRPLSIYLLQAFMEGGFAAVPSIFEAISAILTRNRAAVGPERRRETHFDKRFSWLFRRLLEVSVYHEKKRSEIWGALTQDLSPALVDRILAAARAVGGELGDEFKEAAQAHSRLLLWFTDLRRRTAEPADAANPVGPLSETSPSVAPAPASGAGAEAMTAPNEGESLLPSSSTVKLQVSHHFFDLMAKLRAFELLVEKGQFAKAALVSDDIIRTLDHFDPRLYFPGVFTRFSALLSGHVNQLVPHWDQRDTVEQKILRQFYQVDLQTFIDS